MAASPLCAAVGHCCILSSVVLRRWAGRGRQVKRSILTLEVTIR